MDISKIREYFQFMTVGYIYPDYVTQSIPIKSKSDEDLYFEIDVER